jgi:purine-binding chemotaxis protein CheW
VSEVMQVNSLNLEPPPTVIKNIDTDYISGIVKLNNGTRLIMFLELLKVLNLENMDEVDKFVENAEAELLNSVFTDTIEEEQLVTFYVGQEEYGLNIMQVKEIIRVPEIVKVPNCPSYVEGVVSIRNQLLPIINLRNFFNMDVSEFTDRTRILIVDIGDIKAGILVDRVTEVIRLQRDVIQDPPVYSDGGGEQIKGIAKLKDGKRLILLLDVSKLISQSELKNIKGLGSKSSEFETNTEKLQGDEEQLVNFKLDNEEYGIKIENVQEINRMTQMTKIPRSPYYIEGVVNLRGAIIPALNLRKLFKLPSIEVTDSTRVIIVDFNGKKTGIVVDGVSEVLRFEKSLVEEPPKILSNGLDSEFLEGVGKLDNGKRMILILKLDKILGESYKHSDSINKVDSHNEELTDSAKNENDKLPQKSIKKPTTAKKRTGKQAKE